MSTDTIKSVTFPNIVTGRLRVDPDGSDTTEFGVYSTGTVQLYELGTRHRPDDRVFRYGQAKSAINGQRGAFDYGGFFKENTVAATVLGQTFVEITTDSTSGNVTTGFGVKNNMVGGYFSQPDGTNRQFRRIIGHEAGASGATIKVFLDGPLTRAMVTDSFVEWRANPYSNLRQPGGTTRTVMGVATTTIASNSFGWFQTWGPTYMAQNAAADFGSSYDAVAHFHEGGNLEDADTHANGQVAGFIMGTRSTGSFANPPFVFLTISP